MSECIHGRLKRQCNECDLQEENQQLKARIARLEQSALLVINAYKAYENYETDYLSIFKEVDGLEATLNESPQQLRQQGEDNV